MESTQKKEQASLCNSFYRCFFFKSKTEDLSENRSKQDDKSVPHILENTILLGSMYSFDDPNQMSMGIFINGRLHEGSRKTLHEDGHISTLHGWENGHFDPCKAVDFFCEETLLPASKLGKAMGLRKNIETIQNFNENDYWQTDKGKQCIDSFKKLLETSKQASSASSSSIRGRV